MSKRGRYIVIEGVDGSGKTTQFEQVVKLLNATGVREPGGPLVSEKLRDIIKDKSMPRDPLTNVWLFMAARAELISAVVRPAIASGKTIVSDRNWLSTVAYQSAEGADTNNIYTLAKLATAEFFQPDLLIFIDVTNNTRLERTQSRGGHEKDYFDGLGEEYFTKVRNAYLEHLKQIKNSIIIDGNRSISEVGANIARAIQN